MIKPDVENLTLFGRVGVLAGDYDSDFASSMGEKKTDILGGMAAAYISWKPGADGTYFMLSPEYTYMDGTSMATPHVAGAAALLMAAKPEAPVTDIIRVLKETAKHPDGEEYRPDNRWGYGLIQPVEALNALD